MKLFPQSELKAAFIFAESGGQALLLSRAEFRPPTGRLIDSDYERLFSTVRRLGLKAIIAERIGQPGQSIIIRGRQLDRAVAECRALELEFTP